MEILKQIRDRRIAAKEAKVHRLVDEMIRKCDEQVEKNIKSGVFQVPEDLAGKS
jgi:hypothetical protein